MERRGPYILRPCLCAAVTHVTCSETPLVRRPPLLRRRPCNFHPPHTPVLHLLLAPPHTRSPLVRQTTPTSLRSAPLRSSDLAKTRLPPTTRRRQALCPLHSDPELRRQRRPPVPLVDVVHLAAELGGDAPGRQRARPHRRRPRRDRGQAEHPPPLPPPPLPAPGRRPEDDPARVPPGVCVCVCVCVCACVCVFVRACACFG